MLNDTIDQITDFVKDRTEQAQARIEKDGLLAHDACLQRHCTICNESWQSLLLPNRSPHRITFAGKKIKTGV